MKNEEVANEIMEIFNYLNSFRNPKTQNVFEALFEAFAHKFLQRTTAMDIIFFDRVRDCHDYEMIPLEDCMKFLQWYAIDAKGAQERKVLRWYMQEILTNGQRQATDKMRVLNHQLYNTIIKSAKELPGASKHLEKILKDSEFQCRLINNLIKENPRVFEQESPA